MNRTGIAPESVFFRLDRSCYQVKETFAKVISYCSDIRLDSFFMHCYRPPAPSSGSNNLFGQQSFLQNDSQMSTQPEMKFGTSVGTAFNYNT